MGVMPCNSISVADQINPYEVLSSNAKFFHYLNYEIFICLILIVDTVKFFY